MSWAIREIDSKVAAHRWVGLDENNWTFQFVDGTRSAVRLSTQRSALRLIEKLKVSSVRCDIMVSSAAGRGTLAVEEIW